jgi:hypothetical protein
MLGALVVFVAVLVGAVVILVLAVDRKTMRNVAGLIGLVLVAAVLGGLLLCQALRSIPIR